MDNIGLLFVIAPAASALALVFAYVFYVQTKKKSEGTPRMQEIAKYVRDGAMAYLKQQYKVVTLFFVAAFIFFFFLAFVLHVQSKWVPFAFITGGFFSGLAGFLGMKTATMASARTAEGARHSLNEGLQVAFRSGAVMGLVVVGLGLLDISIWYLVLSRFLPETDHKLVELTVTMLCFGMGASSQALFARVGGGIFTKAADVGADLVGKLEANIPEDDPRNPATIADNVGDNVGDVAGMGADLYESYCGSILASAALGVSAFVGTGLQKNALLLPMIIAGIGVILSIIGIFLVRVKEHGGKDDEQMQRLLLKALGRGINISSILIGVLSLPIVWLVLPQNLGIWGSIVIGLLAGIVIGKSTEYYTSAEYAPTKGVAKQALTGPATVLIEGIATGMMSTWIPVITVVVGIFLSFTVAGGMDNLTLGLYGIGIAAVGMLSTLGLTLATDAYGPIADNAGGNAEMSQLEPYVRKRTDALDQLGNTTAATGKGFAIGSAALTALALLAAYIEEVRAGLVRLAEHAPARFQALVQGTNLDTLDAIRSAGMNEFMQFYNVTLMNPKVLMGVFLGSMLTFLFCALTMKAVGRAAGKMVDEVRRQFREIKGIMEGTTIPEYAKCVDISTKAAQREMILPSMIAIITPVIVGIILGVSGVMGLLVGGLGTGFVLAIMMANAGGAWDNAKKYIEEGAHGGKGSEAHKAAVIGDTVGDPFKDTSGPSLNILIKLISMVSVVVAGLTVTYSIF
ncbi:sodium-translocating pyrophosphatase [bacterium]|nr:sodium-translocating pyrophosphatase [candidate division CSSED10-310 bacterium]